MPRNASGTFTLLNSAFQPNTTISSSAVNGDLSDIATALTQSLASTGVTPMTGPILAADGTVANPSITFNSNQATGFYKAGANQIAWTANGVQGATFNSDTTTTWAGAASLGAGSTMGGKPITAVDSGTAAIFVQTAAPTGWTKSVTHNDKALRIVSGTAGTGGSQAFTSTFTSVTVAQANLPNVNWTVTDPGHTHTVKYDTQGPFATPAGASTLVNDLSGTGGTSATAAAISNTTGITVASGGLGTALNFNVLYVDCIIATKN